MLSRLHPMLRARVVPKQYESEPFYRAQVDLLVGVVDRLRAGFERAGVPSRVVDEVLLAEVGGLFDEEARAAEQRETALELSLQYERTRTLDGVFDLGTGTWRRAGS